MRATYLLYLLFSCICLNVTSQTMFYQDIFHGGVTGTGYSFGVSGGGTGQFELQIVSGSDIKKAFLFCYSYETPEPINITLDTDIYTFSNENQIGSNYYVAGTPPISNSTIHAIEVTNTINSSQNIYSFNCPIQYYNNPPNGKYGAFYLLVIYENNLMPEVSLSIVLNNKDQLGNVNYPIINLNPMNKMKPIGLAVYSDILWDTINDGSYIHTNNHLLGLLGGSDAINSVYLGAGVKGSFYYENETLFGLDDDTPDNVMGGSDGLADISTYITNNDNSLDIDMKKQFPTTSQNIYCGFFLTYTSPCDTFSTTLTPDTTICYGETLQLQATGGVSSGSNTGYEWTAISDSAAIDDLSCTDCPNPVFSGDKSQVYTVRIWNSDSCSVVKPVRIGVSQPQELNAKMFRSICSFSTGKIVLEDLPNNLFQLGAVNPNGDTISPNSSNDFTGLSAGDYTVFYIDEFGCSNDTVIYVEPIISTVAQFNAYPKSGTAPIQINLSNQSQNATDYSWWLNGEYQGNAFSGFYTDTSGVYDIALIAWRNDSICADTTSFTIIVYDSLVAQLPNVFTPNNDGVNDFFNVKVNLPVRYKLSILNRWGNVVFENEGGLAEGTHKLWDGTAENGDFVTDGTYFYTISFALDNETVDCEVTECEVRKDGFVQVFGK